MSKNGLIGEVRGVGKSEYATAAVYVLGLGLIASDLIPTVADGVYFYVERKLRDEYIKGTITAKQYWWRQALYYYSLNPIYWAAILGITVATKGDAKRKLTVMSGLIGAGAVAGVIMNNIKKDIEQQEKEKIIVVPKH